MHLYSMTRGRIIAQEDLEPSVEGLKELHTRLGIPVPGQWLWEHFESGQSLEDYKKSNPVSPNEDLTTIYIQPLGEFSKKTEEIVGITARFLGIYYCLPVTVLETIPSSVIPERATRIHAETKELQILTSYVNSSILLPTRPADAVGYIALTQTDLWPGRDWSFVLGQASLSDRVGVWSLHRFGDPEESEESFKTLLRRSLQTASHEFGHILGINHCIAYRCNLNGSNHLEEADGQPLALCPSCLQKFKWNTGCDLIERFERLEKFYAETGLEEEKEYVGKALHILKS